MIVVLTIRPWGDGSSPAPVAPDQGNGPARATGPEGGTAGVPGIAGIATTPAPGATTPSGEPAPGGEPAGPGADLDITCGSPSGWRAATLQAWAGRSRPIRSWIAIEPVTATGALDPAIPFAPVATGVVTAIGYCAPLDDAERPPATAVASLWAIRDGIAVPMSLLPLEPPTPDALGGLWLRPPEVPASGEPATGPSADLFPPGRYVVELATAGGAYRRWLGIEIADLATLRASAPPASPAASPEAPSHP